MFSARVLMPGKAMVYQGNLRNAGKEAGFADAEQKSAGNKRAVGLAEGSADGDERPGDRHGCDGAMRLDLTQSQDEGKDETDVSRVEDTNRSAILGGTQVQLVIHPGDGSISNVAPVEVGQEVERHENGSKVQVKLPQDSFFDDRIDEDIGVAVGHLQ